MNEENVKKKEKKSKRKLIMILIIIFFVLLISSSIIYYFLVYTKDNNKNVADNNNKDSINNIVIRNTEVKELYNYTQANLNSNWVCLGYFYQNPFKNHNLNDKIELVNINYAYKYAKKIDNTFLQKIIKSDRELVESGPSEYYIDANIVKNGMKLIFNIDVENLENNYSYGGWYYRSDVDAFLNINGGGGYPADIVDQIIEYNELDNEINLTVVKAEIDCSDDNICDIYRYAEKKDTLVYENDYREKIIDGTIVYDFKFNKENINKFPQLKYIFKKNESGKYYVSDIVNLNFEEDFESCD